MLGSGSDLYDGRRIMRQVLIFAGVLLGLGVYAARFADQTLRNAAPPPPPPPATTALAEAPTPAPSHQDSYRSSVVIPPDARGHFVVDARVNGRRMEFMIDTGASAVALRSRDAAALGFHPVPRDLTVEVKTANGTTRAAPVQLGMVEISGLNVRNVVALISPDEGLSENLLGLTFLSRLRRFEFSNGRMVLEQ
jgi:aspartyl protease family protein